MTIDLYSSDLRRLNSEYVRLLAEPQAHWKYRLSISGCDIDGGPALSGHCLAAATAACADNSPEQGRGPLSDVYRWWVDEDGDPLPAVDWPAGSAPSGAAGQQLVGTTCLPNQVPGVSPVPTIEMIVQAFHETRWATARVATQPEGDTTLVNLATYFRVEWVEAGFEPGEIDSVDPARMYGYRVQIRPRLLGYRYAFGDGDTFGPTDSPGGVYPHGDVRHTYTRPGRYTASVAVTLGAQFRINGGPWIEIPDRVTIRQPGTTIIVKEAKAVLVR
ncbi:hypothetical protein [Intrasporangium sp. DVR]|uniref:hypothetical protein n=1 Tax=Intrasporangium sp. DVR TaxID=3127867 RepID=UPI00333EF8A9